MLNGDLKMALTSLRKSKWRSLLTMFGIIIGVASVVTTVSLGVGVKQQVVGQIGKLGKDLITIRPGKIVSRDSEGRITKVNALGGYSFSSGSLPVSDLKAVHDTNGVKTTVPLGVVGDQASVDGHIYSQGYVIGTSPDMPDILKQKVDFGSFFSPDETDRQFAVIGHDVAVRLFHDSSPIGMSLKILGQDFVIEGVFDTISSSPLPLGPDFNKTIFIPYDTAQTLTNNSTRLAEILVKPTDPNNVGYTISQINQTMSVAHGGQNDYAVLKQDENLTVTNDILNLLTAFVAGIASISLFVGGIGIMNIMFLAVTERTREIGVRKAIGATNQQILGQFLIEALVLSFVGSVIGLLVAAVINLLLRIFTHLQPAITVPIILIACAVSIAVGVLFGIIPAAKAASKDPIDALRYE